MKPQDHPLETISAFLDGEVDAEVRKDVAAHLRACPSCRLLAADLQRLDGAIASEPVPPAPADLPARIGWRLRGSAGSEGSSVSRLTRWTRISVAGGAVAAALAVAVVVMREETPRLAPGSATGPGHAQHEASPESTPGRDSRPPVLRFEEGARARAAASPATGTQESTGSPASGSSGERARDGYGVQVSTDPKASGSSEAEAGPHRDPPSRAKGTFAAGPRMPTGASATSPATSPTTSRDGLSIRSDPPRDAPSGERSSAGASIAMHAEGKDVMPIAGGAMTQETAGRENIFAPSPPPARIAAMSPSSQEEAHGEIHARSAAAQAPDIVPAFVLRFYVFEVTGGGEHGAQAALPALSAQGIRREVAARAGVSLDAVLLRDASLAVGERPAISGSLVPPGLAVVAEGVLQPVSSFRSGSKSFTLWVGLAEPSTRTHPAAAEEEPGAQVIHLRLCMSDGPEPAHRIAEQRLARGGVLLVPVSLDKRSAVLAFGIDLPASSEDASRLVGRFDADKTTLLTVPPFPLDESPPLTCE